MKPPAAAPRPVVVAGDAVVEQQRAGAHLRLQEAEVGGVVGDTDVLGQPDGGHRVEPGLPHVAVVAVPDFGEVGQALVRRWPAAPTRPARRTASLRWSSRRDARRSAPCRPTRSPRRAAGRLASAAASRTPAGTCSPAPPPASRPRRGSSRRCRSSTARAPTRRTCSTRRSGGGWRRRRESCCGASPLRCAASAAAPPAEAGRSA